MKCPTRIRVLGKVYSIEETENVQGGEDHEVLSGHCAPLLCHIQVSTEQHIQQIRDSLLHELLHAIWSESGLCCTIGEERIEEHLVHTLASAILALLRDNPALVRYLTAKETP